MMLRSGRIAHRAWGPCAARAPQPLLRCAAAAHSLHGTPSPDLSAVLFTEDQVQTAIADLGRRIGADYAGKPLLVVGILKGGFMFTADLARAIHPVPPSMEIDFMKVSSYGTGMESSGTVTIGSGFDVASCSGKHVLVVDEMVDSGLTLAKVSELLRTEGGAASVKVACALNKMHERKRTVFTPDYVGLQCPDEFVVGYGNDYLEQYRYLPYVGVLSVEAMARRKAEAEAKASAKATAGAMP